METLIKLAAKLGVDWSKIVVPLIQHLAQGIKKQQTETNLTDPTDRDWETL